jgi:serine protease inhibitor
MIKYTENIFIILFDFVHMLENTRILRFFFFLFKGTEAAAATVVRLIKRRRVASEIQPIEFKADRPFIFMIRELNEDITLFSGKFLSSI